MARRTALIFCLLTVMLDACGGSAVLPATTAPTTTPTTSAPTAATTTTTATTAPTTSSPPPPVDRIALERPSALGPAWVELFTLPYGDAPEDLGTSPGGDGAGIMWGPDYGTQMPDGTWWFLDSAHARLAQFDDTGAYLSAVVLPEEYLAGGTYVQYQGPQALADGTLVLSSTTPDSPGLLLMSPDRSFTLVPLPGFVAIHAGDGQRLYGFDEAGTPVRLDPVTGDVTPVAAFAGQTGDTYSLMLGEGLLGITRPGVDLELPILSAAAPDALVYPMVEAVMGADGVLSVLVIGMVEEAPGEAVTLVGYFSVDRDGRVSPVEAVREPTSASDPGTGSHLGIGYGDDRPWLMFIDTDGVRVFRREG